MSLPPPDLETPQGLAAYRAELRRAGMWFRWPGFGLIVIGALWTLAASRSFAGLRPENVVIGYALLAIGWIMLVLAFIVRNRYHRRRMSGEA